jgi:flavin-dependent dehydrogenase
MTRERFDAWLLAQAVDAGASLEEGALVDAPLVESNGVVSGVRISTSRGVYARRAVITIGADGRRSRLAWTSGLSVHPTSPRRWAIGAYYAGVEALTDVGEMHVRRGHYIGVAPLPGGLGNACLVLPRGVDPHQWRTPGDLLETFLRGDPQLGPRFRTARRASPVGVLGPMAVDSLAAGRPGLLLAGDAAGFIDPMTGDGIRLAFAGAELAADIAADVLSGRIAPGAAHAVLLARRRATLGLKWRFNRTLRGLVASPAAVAGAAVAARVCPPMFGALIRYAGDCA